MPAPLAASPASVEQVLSPYLSEAQVAGLTGDTCRQALREFARRGIGGGRIYDAVIAHCSYEAGATLLLTWNRSHFLPVAPAGLAILEPSAE